MVNYFWLSLDPKESAGWYCDQHCFKIGSEVIETAWDAVLELCPRLGEKADEEGIPMTYRRRRHAKPGHRWHPLSFWTGMCRGNLERALVNAEAIFEEHLSRKGTRHSAWNDHDFLKENLDRVKFHGKRWDRFFAAQSIGRPEGWLEEHATFDGVLLSDLDDDERYLPRMTEPPQCINEDVPEFEGCRVPGDVVKAYRKYYAAKTLTVAGGMRYYYTKPPKWLRKYL